MSRFFAVALCLLVAVVGISQAKDTKNELTCQICTDIVTDIANFITSDTTEQQLIEFVEQLCSTLGSIVAGFEETCNAFVEANLPTIVDSIVNENLNPEQICMDIFACP